MTEKEKRDRVPLGEQSQEPGSQATVRGRWKSATPLATGDRERSRGLRGAYDRALHGGKNKARNTQ